MGHPLLEGIIDYAGLFPPARLPLDAAWPRYLAHLHTSQRWMLARFVLPASRLEALAAHADAPPTPYRLTLLGSGGEDPDTFARALEHDLAALAAFHRAQAAFARAESFEVSLPPSLLDAPASVAPMLAGTADAFAGTDIETLFFEVPLGAHLREGLPRLLESFRTFNDTGRALTFGLKLRTGGLTPEAFPSPEHLARALVAAYRAGVPFKATAGLHHPVRAPHAEVGTHMHGFLNVFGGAALLHAHDLDPATLTTLLEEEDAEAFRLGPEGFAWREIAATPESIQAARRFATSFGSCSFDEPVEDLRTLGML